MSAAVRGCALVEGTGITVIAVSVAQAASSNPIPRAASVIHGAGCVCTHVLVLAGNIARTAVAGKREHTGLF